MGDLATLPLGYRHRRGAIERRMGGGGGARWDPVCGSFTVAARDARVATARLLHPPAGGAFVFDLEWLTTRTDERRFAGALRSIGIAVDDITATCALVRAWRNLPIRDLAAEGGAVALHGHPRLEDLLPPVWQPRMIPRLPRDAIDVLRPPRARVVEPA